MSVFSTTSSFSLNGKNQVVFTVTFSVNIAFIWKNQNSLGNMRLFCRKTILKHYVKNYIQSHAGNG